MTIRQYAAYGSNLHPYRLIQRVPSAKLIGPARVPGFDLRFHKRSVDGSGKCDIVRAVNEIYVAVYEIPVGEKRLLDEVEGLGGGYDETTIEVPGHGDCWTYIAAESHVDPKLAPYSWYKALVLAGCEYNGFPSAYIQAIRAISAERDQDQARHRKNTLLLDTMRGVK